MKQKVQFPVSTTPLALLALCILSYGFLLSKLGVHFDDWSLLWVSHFLGPAEFKEAFLVDRPLLGRVYFLTNSLLGENPLVWQIFSVFVRWLSCVSFWWMLRGLWPSRTLEVTGMAFLFAVYPGFVSIHIPFTYSHHILFLSLTLFSLGAMIWAIRTAKWFWFLYPLSILTGAFSLFTMEYYFGLELLRPIFLWMVLGDQIPQKKTRLKRTALYYFSFLLVVFAFLIWRMSTPTPRGEIILLQQILTNPIDGVIATVKMVLQDLFKVAFLAWGQVFRPADFISSNDIGLSIRYAMISLASAVLTIVFLFGVDKSKHPNKEGLDRRWAITSVVLGLIALILGGIPVWTTNLHLEISFPWDRFTIAMMAGVSLFLLGLLVLISWRRWQLVLLTGLLVGFGSGWHFQNAISVLRDWQMQKDFFWQLAWRAPDLKRGTTVIVSELPFTFSSAYSLTAPLNWMYAPQNHSFELQTVLLDARLYLIPEDFQSMTGKKEIPIDVENRMLYFHGSTSQAIYLLFQPPGCMKIIDPTIHVSLPQKPPLFRELLPLSNLALIDVARGVQAVPPHYFFGPEPARTWCYYFEKADLARQMGDWEQITAMGNRVFREPENNKPKDPSEYLPFILGYGHMGDWDKAASLTQKAFQQNPKLKLTLCQTWQNLIQENGTLKTDQLVFSQLDAELQCGLK